MKLYKVSMVIMAVFAILLAILTIYDIYYETFDLYKPFVYVLLGLFFIAQFICLFTQKFNAKNIGFFLLHTGIVVFLVGIFIYKIVGINVSTQIPVDNLTYSQISRGSGEFVDLGFQIGVTDFEVTKYDPIYSLHELNSKGEWKEVKKEIEPNDQGTLDFGKYGEISAKTVEDNNVQNQYKMADDLIVFKSEPDKFYEASLIIVDDSGTEPYSLVMNKPYRKNGWIVYLMAHSADQSAINVLFKYDPVETVSTVGLWMLIIGTFVMCFKGTIRKKDKGGAA